MDVKRYTKLKAWLDGKLVDYGKAQVPILTHSLQYGSGIFEGIRAYKTEKGTAIFRLGDHVNRFFDSAKIYSMKLPCSKNELSDAITGVVKANKLDECYIRPFAFYSDDSIGLSVTGKRISVFVAAVPFGAYFGSSGHRGLKCKVSSWHRINSEILPVEAKASGNYLNSILAGIEARKSGFDEAILTSIDGDVAEGPAENIFLVKGSRIITPDVDSDILIGITRDTVIQIAESIGFAVQERLVKRDELYIADELFFTGTAAEITPIVNVDGTRIGKGVGPITKLISSKYGEIVHGKNSEFSGWLTYI